MRKFTPLILLMLLLLPLTTTAQERQLVFDDLDANFTVSDLQFTFPYPSTWAWDASDGIVLAETEADIAAYSDDDDATLPEGMTITLNAFPVDTFGLEDPTLDSLVEFIVEVTELQVVETVDIGVMARRSVSVIGTNATGRAGIGTAWIQDGYVVLFSLGTPETAITGDIGYSWGIILGSITPISDFELTETLDLPQYGLTLSYPTDWTPVINDTGISLYELESDASRADTSEGLAFILAVIDVTPEDFGLPAEPETADYITVLNTLVTVEEPALAPEELIVLGFEGASVLGLDGDQSVIAALLYDVEGERLMLTGMGNADGEYLVANQPVLMAILRSISILEE